MSNMKSTGIARRVDELGRVVIPIELRKKLEIENQDSMEIFVDKDNVILRKLERSCIFCGSEKELQKYFDKLICKKCCEKIKNI